jgi:hypothetical protein
VDGGVGVQPPGKGGEERGAEAEARDLIDHTVFDTM